MLSSGVSECEGVIVATLGPQHLFRSVSQNIYEVGELPASILTV
jgi:hypothetical protein